METDKNNYTVKLQINPVSKRRLDSLDFGGDLGILNDVERLLTSNENNPGEPDYPLALLYMGMFLALDENGKLPCNENSEILQNFIDENFHYLFGRLERACRLLILN